MCGHHIRCKQSNLDINIMVLQKISIEIFYKKGVCLYPVIPMQGISGMPVSFYALEIIRRLSGAAPAVYRDAPLSRTLQFTMIH